MWKQLRIGLSEEERAALVRLSEHEMRSMEDQVRYILHGELERLGYLQPPNHAVHLTPAAAGAGGGRG